MSNEDSCSRINARARHGRAAVRKMSGRCWAAGVSPCDGPITEEHYISYGLFDSATVTVATGPLAKTGPKRIPIKRLVTHTLCRGHNQGLADLDQAAIDFQNVLRRIAALHTERTRIVAARGSRRWRKQTFTVDGSRLERWLLKTAFSAAPVFRELNGDWQPSPEQVALALGLRPFGESLGLYAVAPHRGKVTNENHINFSFGRRVPGGPPVAFTVSLLGGYRLACAWERARSANDVLLFDGSQEQAALLQPPPAYSFHIDEGEAGLMVRFDTSGGWKASRNPEVTALRSRYPAPPR